MVTGQIEGAPRVDGRGQREWFGAGGDGTRGGPCSSARSSSQEEAKLDLEGFERDAICACGRASARRRRARRRRSTAQEEKEDGQVDVELRWTEDS